MSERATTRLKNSGFFTAQSFHTVCLIFARTGARPVTGGHCRPRRAIGAAASDPFSEVNFANTAINATLDFGGST
jgi:hypothetical protein